MKNNCIFMKLLNNYECLFILIILLLDNIDTLIKF